MEQNLIKVGSKGKHMALPEGWRKLKNIECIKRGDKFANLATFKWSLVDGEDIGLCAENYDAVIRKDI